MEPESILKLGGGARVFLVRARVYLVGARVYLSLVIIVSPQSQLDFWIWDFFGSGIGVGSRGTGLGTRAWQYYVS